MIIALWILTILVFLVFCGFLRWSIGKVIHKAMDKLTHNETVMLCLSISLGLLMIGVVVLAVANVFWAFSG